MDQRRRGRPARRAAVAGAVPTLVALVALVGPVAAAGEASRPDAAGARVQPRPAAEEDGEQFDVPEPVAEAVGEVLDELAAALLRADADAVADLVADADGEVGQRWRARAANLAGVDVDELRLRLDHRAGLLTTDRARARLGDDVDAVVVVGAVEEHVLAGQDLDGPARYGHTLTFVLDDERWRLADDRDGRVLGRPEPGFLWDLAPVSTTAQGSVLALHTAGGAGVAQLVEETAAALDQLPARWPAPWSGRVTMVVPDDREQLSHVVGGSLELDDFLAFASATTYSAPGVHEITGTRLVVNPDRFPSDPQARERVLLHELLHVASRPVASARLPLWLEEGIAQALGEQGPSTGHTRQLDATGPAGRRLPTDAEFSSHGRDATFLAYQRSYRFLEHLVERAGVDAVVDFYVAVGASATRAGTVGHRVDAAAERELGADLDTLVVEWRASG